VRPAVASGNDALADLKTRLSDETLSALVQTSGERRLLWLAEAAIQGYFRDILLAIAQIARGPFETHIREHFVWPDASRSPKQASKMSRTQAYQGRNAFDCSLNTVTVR
jgi:hypothetical protein